MLALIYHYDNVMVMNKHILNKAIKKAGSQAELARILEVSRQLICNVKRGTPAGERLTNKINDYLSGNNNEQSS